MWRHSNALWHQIESCKNCKWNAVCLHRHVLRMLAAHSHDTRGKMWMQNQTGECAGIEATPPYISKQRTCATQYASTSIVPTATALFHRSIYCLTIKNSSPFYKHQLHSIRYRSDSDIHSLGGGGGPSSFVIRIRICDETRKINIAWINLFFFIFMAWILCTHLAWNSQLRVADVHTRQQRCRHARVVVSCMGCQAHCIREKS